MQENKLFVIRLQYYLQRLLSVLVPLTLWILFMPLSIVADHSGIHRAFIVC
jgi:hypothetical protein